MGKAGRVLKQVLETYNISQNKLAVTMGLERTVVYRWTSERTDPVGDTITSITAALTQLNPEAAQAFIDLYLGEIVQGEEDA